MARSTSRPINSSNQGQDGPTTGLTAKQNGDIMNTAWSPQGPQRQTEPSVQATPPQVIGYDDISDGIKDKLDVVGVCGTGHVGVHLFAGGLVLALVLTLDVGDSLQVRVWPCVEKKKEEEAESDEDVEAAVIQPANTSCGPHWHQTA